MAGEFGRMFLYVTVDIVCVCLGDPDSVAGEFGRLSLYVTVDIVCVCVSR